MLYHTYIYIVFFISISRMPNITIYLNAELYEKVKKNPSKIIQEALANFFNKQKKNPQPNDPKGK